MWTLKVLALSLVAGKSCGFQRAPTALMAAIALAYALPDAAIDAATAAASQAGLATWLMASVVTFALIFAINSSIHSFLVVHYAKHDKVATSVGFYYMSNAVGRLLGTLGSGVLYTYSGDQMGSYAGTDARRGLFACFVAGTISSALAALITIKIQDEAAGLRCGPCVCVAKVSAGGKDASSAAETGEAAATPEATSDAPKSASEVVIERP